MGDFNGIYMQLFLGRQRVNNPQTMSHLTSCLVIGAGASGLALSHVLNSSSCDDWLLVEARPELGGKIKTIRDDGVVLELGPTGWLDHQPEWLKMADSLGLSPLHSDVADDQRLLLDRGKLKTIPAIGPRLLRADFLSASAKIRLALSVLHPRQLPKDESVYSHGMRRFGRQLTETLLDAAASGLFAGDPQKMSVRASFPQLLSKPSKGPPPKICSFKNGMDELVKAARRLYAKNLRLNCEISKLEFDGKLWRAWSNEELVAETAQVVTTLPAEKLLAILGEQAPDTLSVCQAAISRTDLAVVAGAWPDEDIEHPCNGFGVLSPRGENAGFLNVQFIHSIFPEHVKPGFKVLKTMLGGAADPQIAARGQNELSQLAFGKLRNLLGIKGPPEKLWVHQIPGGVPQYQVGHLQRLAAAEAELAEKLPGLHLAGDSFHGVGLNPAIRRAHQIPIVC